jgi:hypothetical protein
MGLFGKKKAEEPEKENLNEQNLDDDNSVETIDFDNAQNDAAIEIDEIDDDAPVIDFDNENAGWTESELAEDFGEIGGFEEDEVKVEADLSAAENEDENADSKVVSSPEDKFKERAALISRSLRMMFPQQMLIGFYYAELQADGYIDDFCCYATNGELLEKDEIPERTGMNDAEMIAREERLEQAFFLFRRAAVEFTGKPCNGVTVILMSNGQAKIDIVSQELVEGEEDQRYEAFRRKVEAADPRFQPPQMSEKTLAAIREKTHGIYAAMGQSFYNFIPGNEFKVAYFYSEFGEHGVFYYYRCFLNDGTMLEKENIFEHYGIDLSQAEERRNEIITHAISFRDAFVSEGVKPFTAISLTITGDGKFTTNLNYGPTDEAGEEERLNIWKANNNGEGFPPVERPAVSNGEKKISEVDPALQEQVNSIYMELGTEFFSFLPEVEFHRSYFLCEFGEDGVFTYQRMVLNDGSTVEGDDMFEKYDMDVTEAENNRSKIIELINNIREMIANEGEKTFTSMTLAISDKGEFRSYMGFDPADAETRDERLEAWKAQFNGGEAIG